MTADDTANLPPLPRLTDSLYNCTVDVLKWYSKALADKAPTRKDDLVAVLAQALTTPAEVRRLWGQLTAPQQAVLAEVVYSGDGRYDPDVVEARYPAVRAPRSAADSHGYYNYTKTPPSAFDVFFFQRYDLGIYIPPDVVAVLRTVAAPPPPTLLPSHADLPLVAGRLEGDDPPDLRVTETERAVLPDLTALLYLVQQGKVSVSAATRLPTLPALRQVRGRLLIGDYFPEDDYARAEDAMRPLALVVLAQAARWAAPGGTSGSKLELTKSGQAILNSGLTAAHLREAWDRWLKSDLLDELTRIKAIKGQQAKEVRLTKPAERRAKLAAGLRACPVGQWVLFDDWLRYLRAERALPVIERNALSGLHLGYYGYYGDYTGYNLDKYWDIIIGSYLRVTVWEYVATLGLIEIAYTRPAESPHDFGDYELADYDADYLSRYDGLVALRLTELGAYVLGLRDSYTPPTAQVAAGPPLLKVLPNLDLVVTDSKRLLPNDRAFLERIGTPQSEDVYRLHRDLLLEAGETGLDLDAVQAFLAAKSGQAPTDLPQTVRVFFSDLARRVGALRLGSPQVVLESDDGLLLTELAHQPGLRAQVQLARIGDRTVLLVPADQEAAVRRQLKKLGYVPQKSGAGPSSG